MSSILRALKKIDDDDARHRGALLRNKPFWQGLYDKRSSSERGFVLPPWGIIVLCLILFCSWRIEEYYRNNNDEGSLPFMPQTLKPHRKEAVEFSLPQQGGIDQEKQTSKQSIPLFRQHSPPQFEKSKYTTNPLPLAANAFVAKKAKIQLPLEMEAVPLKATSSQANFPKLINPTELKLQAVTWDSNPEFRFVVLNDRIAHRGETVDGYIVHSIDQDTVTVKKNDTYWEVKFRTRRESVTE